MVKVSVIMPAYKTEQTISSSIQSVIEQTFLDWELIIIDDGSPDHVNLVAHEWVTKDQRIQVYQQENKGVASARNHGLEKSRGKYIAFLDSDDSWEPQFLEKMLNHLEDEKLDFVYSGFSKGTLKKKKNMGSPYTSNDILYAYCSNRQTLWICAMVVSSNLLKQNQISFSEGIRYMEDVEFLIKILTHAHAGVVKEALANYCRRDDSATGQGWNRNQEDMILALTKALEYVKENYKESNKNEVIVAIEKNRVTRLVRFLWKAIQVDKAYAIFLLDKYKLLLRDDGRNTGHKIKAQIILNPKWWKLVDLIK